VGIAIVLVLLFASSFGLPAGRSRALFPDWIAPFAPTAIPGGLPWSPTGPGPFLPPVGGAPPGTGRPPSGGGPPPPSPPPPPPPNATGVATLAPLGPREAVTSPDFWGVVIQTNNSTGIATDPAIGAYLAKTPFRWFSYTFDTDSCNMSANLFYPGNGQVSSPCPFSIPSFVRWCDSQHPTCESILKLPGENNNSSEDAYYASWVVHDLAFQPTYWTIGNEPMLWTHYGLPWADWRTTDHLVPTPLAYAWDAHAAILAVKAVDPAAHFIGIESDCECSAKDYMAAVAHVDGPLIDAVGYHTYPSTALLTNETLAQFFAPLSSPKNITTSYATVRAAISGECANCSTMPILVTEYNSGPGRGSTQWAGTYADASFLAASTAQALRDNVTMFLIYNLEATSAGNRSTIGWGLLHQNGSAGPEGVLYADLFSHFATGSVYASSIEHGIGSVYSVVSRNATTTSLLVVNENLSSPLTLQVDPSILGLSAGATPTLYSWSWNLSAPEVATGALASSILVPPLGMVLIDVPSSG
jgi:hypothetical protein